MNSWQSPPGLPEQYWYGEPGKVNQWFYGVFEGGGAKGLAYKGALDAMAQEGCWFVGVAGASAGAITAALVAAGMSPEEIGEQTESLLGGIKPKMWKGLFTLQRAEGYFSSDGLRKCLDEQLGKQLAKRNGGTTPSEVTFEQLHAATGVELNVVAADLSLNNQIVFSHHDTPNCVVADAVVASASIPFAFASRVLEVEDCRDREGRPSVSHHTIVDGGVWANFPMFIFEDRAFREDYGREPVEIEPRDILGFVLDECGEQGRVKGPEVKFVREKDVKPFIARERVGDGKKARPSSLLATIGSWLLLPFYLLGLLVGRGSGKEYGRWPTPKTRAAKYFVGSIDAMLGGIRPILYAFVPVGLVGYGAWRFINWLATEQLRMVLGTDWLDPNSYIGRPVSFLLALTLCAIAVLFVFATALVVAANFFLLRTSRRVLYGLVTTFVAGSGAPRWAGKKENVVRLPIDPEVTTLSFEMTNAQQERLIESAKQATLDALAKVLGEGRRAAAPPPEFV